MRALVPALIALSVAGALPAGAQSIVSPYRDQQSTEVKGLSDAEVAELRDGKGMGLARAAELNGYPGPRHVLDAVAAHQLHAGPEQVRLVEQIFEEMAGKARWLGEQIVAEEGALEAAFRAGSIETSDLGRRVARIAALRGDLRAVHLAAHVQTRAVLTPAQIARYNEVRGYQPGGAAPPHRH